MLFNNYQKTYGPSSWIAPQSLGTMPFMRGDYVPVHRMVTSNKRQTPMSGPFDFLSKEKRQGRKEKRQDRRYDRGTPILDWFKNQAPTKASAPKTFSNKSTVGLPITKPSLVSSSDSSSDSSSSSGSQIPYGFLIGAGVIGIGAFAFYQLRKK